MKLFATLLLLLSITFNTYAQDTSNFYKKLSEAAIELTKNKVRYDASYFEIKYPNGDIPADKGVNSDVIIRAYRKLGIDLQKEVHEDIAANFDEYPITKMWGQNKPDTNIDHRRVPNLQVFFSRNGTELPISEHAEDYAPGDIVTWNLPNGVTHIGIVTDKKSNYGTPLVVHNSASGQVLQNVLFHFQISGHYQYIKALPKIDDLENNVAQPTDSL